ncbi:MAG: ECF-type sigma factor [Planctomycetaceae bacterium]
MNSTRNEQNSSEACGHSCDSVTQWICDAKSNPSGDSFVRLWHRYMKMVARIATSHLSLSLRRFVDGEDIASEVFSELSSGFEDGRFHHLDDRDDLWQILVVLTERRARHWYRRSQTEKRGGGKPEFPIDQPAGSNDDLPFSQIADKGPTPQDAAYLSDELNNFLHTLPGDSYRRIAIDWLTGFTQQEIAHRHSIGVGSVERKLRIVRESLRKFGSEACK